MAPRKKSTQNKEFFEAILMLEKEKGIPADFLLEKVCTAIVTSVRKDYGGADVVFCDCNPEKYDIKVVTTDEILDEHNKKLIAEYENKDMFKKKCLKTFEIKRELVNYIINKLNIPKNNKPFQKYFYCGCDIIFT